jgi:hypothetical protein
MQAKVSIKISISILLYLAALLLLVWMISVSALSEKSYEENKTFKNKIEIRK